MVPTLSVRRKGDTYKELEQLDVTLGTWKKNNRVTKELVIEILNFFFLADDRRIETLTRNRI